ncbi:dimethylallyl tryptophan synthase [Colletotrichum tofieldiae]|nr:dimethylallyl tryptophan synthase [Colletotrichum tofieldiae]
MVTTANQPTSMNKVLAQAPEKWNLPRTADSDWWWQVLGSQFKAMLSAAGYSIFDQSTALVFFYQWVTPRLGPKPISSEAVWKSFMTDDHSPSSTPGNGASVTARPSIEPIGHYAGTASDPLNQNLTCDFLAQLYRSGQQGLNLEWFNHFKHALLGPGTPASKAEVASQSTLFVAFEITSSAIGVKAYFIPVDAPGNSASDQISRAIASASCPNLAARNQLDSFLRKDIYGRTVKPFMLGIDCISPAESRLKVYSRSRVTTFELVRHVMSVGGQRKGIQKAENQLHKLWKLTLGLPDDFPVDRELSYNSHETAGVLFYFDVAPKSALPDVKVYIPVRHYGPSDVLVANGLVQYLKSQSQGIYAQKYLETLKAFATREDINNSNGIIKALEFRYSYAYYRV